MIIWMVEKLFHAAAPKILKILEEPPDKTLFILIAEKTEHILSTILSRTQIIKIPPIDDDSLTEFLLHKKYDPQTVADAVRMYSGDFTEVRKFLLQSDDDAFFTLFMSWMRSCYAAKMVEVVDFAGNMAKNTREFQKSFLNYCLRMTRESFLLGNGNESLTRMKKDESEFAKKFNPFINKRNILQINKELNDAVFHIERNVNSNIMFLDLSLRFMKLLKK
jgi:DNA polymerase-3 subunit delta'